jgi:glutamyl-tRNA reductase
VILVVGLSHKTAPVEVRERLSAGADALPVVLSRLAARPELQEVMFLSTCNRVEVVALAKDTKVDDALRAIREELAQHGGLPQESDLAPFLYHKRGDEAVTHAFRVAASLESMVLGEPQILGQVKQAYDAAHAAGALKGMLGRCVNKAFTVAKRVRTETSIGAGTVSIASVAVDLARRIFGDLDNHSVLLLGAGEMAEAAAKGLSKGARAVRICNRSFERAATLAATMHASATPWEQLEQEMAQADVVVASTASRVPVVRADMVKRVMKARRGRTLFFVDIAVPRNIEASIHGLDNVFVFNVDDLEQEVARGLQARHAELAAAEKIVKDEVDQFLAWTRGLQVQPTIVAMRTKAHAVMFGELERSLASRLKHLPEGDRAALAQMLESALGKLLHAPSAHLRARASEGEDAGELASALRFLFDLKEIGPEAEPPSKGDAPASVGDAVKHGGDGTLSH